MWSAIRYRRLQALVLLVLAAIITACAVLAPLHHRAMQQALTRLTLDAATAGDTAIQVRSLSILDYDASAPTVPTVSPESLAGFLPDYARPWFEPPVNGTSLLVTRADRTSRSPTGDLLWREGACEHVTFVAGGCPREPGDIAISPADQTNHRLRVGSVVEVVEQPAVEPPRLPGSRPLRVTGVYRQVPGRYWTDQLLTGVSGFIDTRPPYRPMHDTWLTAAGTFSGPGAPLWLDPEYSVTYQLDRRAAGVDEVVRAGPMVRAMVEQSLPEVDDTGQPLPGSGEVAATVGSGLPRISETVGQGRRQALVTVPLLMIQLGLLALAVLGLTLGAAVAQRRPEVAVARLRGASRTDARRMVLAELLPVVLAGVPVGVALALGASALVRRTTLRGAAPFELTAAVWLAIAGAVLLLAAVTWVAAAVGTRDRIAALLRAVPARDRGRGPGAADLVVIAAAGTAVVAFATGGLRGPLALAAPALLALVAGLLLAHLIVPVATRLGRRLTARGRYAAALSVLGVARRPGTRRVVTVVTVASALLVFSTYAVDVGARNRQLAAERENGAAMVADLTGTDVARVRDALAPVAGDRATTVVRIASGEGGFRTTLAVDPEPFGRIALSPDSDPAATPWSGLRIPTGRRLSLTGRAVSLRVATGRFLSESGGPPSFQLELLDAAGDQRNVLLGEIPAEGARTLGAAVPCAAGCTVVGLGLRSPYGLSFSGQVTIGAVRVAGGSTDLPGTAADWRPGVDEDHLVEAAAAGPGELVVDMDSAGLRTPGLTSRYFPEALPAVVSGRGSAPSGGTILGDTLRGTERRMASIAELPRTPAVAGAGVVVDLDLLQHWGSRTGKDARIQVWFDTEDPAVLAGVRTALRGAGVEIAGVRRVSDVRDAYAASVPAWSLQLGVLVAVAGLLLAALVLVLLMASTWRLRSRDLACLAMSGVPRRALGRLAVGEQLPVVLVAALAGGACGILGTALALPTVPLFAESRPRSTLDLSAPWLSVLGALAVALVVLGVVAWLCGRTVAARAGLSRVRDSL